LSDEFYVGYQPQAPPRLGRWIERWVILCLAIALGLGGLIAWRLTQLPAATFEWGEPRRFIGMIESEPVAALVVPRPGIAAPGVAPNSRFALVATGKWGASLEEFEGQWVELEGALIYREDQTMLEMVEGSLIPLQHAPTAPSPRKALGTHSFLGEIIDAKCYLGVMNPGDTKPHKACAIRCISGGVPPILMVRDRAGSALYLWLRSADGDPVNAAVLDVVAERVQITGEVDRVDDTLVLRASPSTYQRLDP